MAGSGERITVIGAGYVGLVNAVCLADVGHTVRCFDIDPARIERLSRGTVDILEPELPELVAKQLDSGRLSFLQTPDEALASASIVLLCVDTPTDPARGADLRNLMRAVDSVLQHGEHASTVVLRSTVPPGTGASVSRRLNHDNGRKRVDVVVHPEFFQEGRAVADCRNPSRIVVGAIDATAAQRVADLWMNSSAPRVVTDVATAEMIKQASNAFLAAKISFINDIARICDSTGATVDMVAYGMGLDPRIGMRYLSAGLGFGGSCLPKDLRALIAAAHSLGWSPPTLEAALKVNDDQISVVAQKISERLDGLVGKRIAILGLTFKPGTADFRDSPSVSLATHLSNAGALIAASDPCLGQFPGNLLPDARLLEDPVQSAAGAEAVVLATAWPEFVTLDWGEVAKVMSGDLVVDGRNALAPETIAAAGLRYIGTGRGGPAARA